MNESGLVQEQRAQFSQICAELEPFLEAELYEQALSRLDLIVDGIPAEDSYRLFRGALLARRADILLDAGQGDDAWRAAQRAMNAGWYTPSVYAIAGWAMLDTGDLEQALAQFQAGLALDPHHASSHMGTAMVHVDEERFPEALDALEAILAADPTHASALSLRAEIRCQQDAYADALTDLVAAQQYAGRDPDLSLLHARVLYALGRSDEALAALSDWIDSCEEPPLEMLLFRACLRLAAKESKSAQTDAIRASNAFSDEPFAFVVLSRVQLSQGKAKLARKAAERAVELDPSLPDGYLALAEAFGALGQTKEAAAEMERVSGEPPELATLLLGPAASAEHATRLLASIHGVGQQAARPTAAAPPPPGSNPTSGPGAAFDPSALLGAAGGGLNPMALLRQICDDEGNIRPMFRPILKMALKNAPQMLKSMPPSVLEKMGGLDPELLSKIDMGEISEEEFAAQLKTVYRVLKESEDGNVR